MGYQLSRSGFSAAKIDSEMRNRILLNSQWSVDLLCDPALVTDIPKVYQKLILATNVGELSSNTKAMGPGYGPLWFHEKAMTYVFSLAAMEERFQVTHHSGKESAFIVQTTKGSIQFIKGPENLFYYKS